MTHDETVGPLRGEYRVFGPPGVGKTTYCARQVARAAERFGSDAVIVASFTRAAAREIGSRELPLDPGQCGTLHAHCWRALGRPLIAETFITKAPKDSTVVPWNEAHPRFALSGDRSDEDVANVQRATAGDQIMQSIQIHRGRMDPIEAWGSHERDFYAAWQDWCEQHKLVDFTSLIERSIDEVDVAPGAPAVGIFDEVQDFTPLQLKLIRRWVSNMQFAILAGDDDQTLYSWIGCSPDAFLNPPVPAEQKRLLGQSHRVPRVIHELATQWIEQVGQREPKPYAPRDAEGVLRHSPASWKRPELLLHEIEEHLAADASVMLLASCSYMLRPLITVLRDRGIPFHNPYRRQNGAWNPLGPRKGISSADRLLAFLRPDASVWGDQARFWTVPDLRAWVSALRARDVLKRGAKTRLEAMDDEEQVTWDLLVELIHEQHLNAVFEGDLCWFEQHVLDRKKFEFPLKVFSQFGIAGLRDDPKVIPGTIHSVKGGEADQVYLWPDLSPDGYWQGWAHNPDPTIRQFYVGMTRAREGLTLCQAAGTTAISWRPRAEVLRAA